MNKKHLFLATMHPNQNFKQWMYQPIKNIFQDNVEFDDILNFYEDLNLAKDIEEQSFVSYKFLQYFFKQDLYIVNQLKYEQLVAKNYTNIHWMADAHFRLFLFPQTIIELSKKNISSIGYLGDCFMNFDINKFWLPIFDFIRVSNSEILDKYKDIRYDSYWQKYGVNQKIFEQYDIEKEYDIIFIGRPYGNRIEILEYIVKNIPNIKFALYGAKEWENNSILKSYYKGYLSNNDFYKEISKAKISLALLEGPDGKTPHFNAKVFDSAFEDVLVLSTYYDVLLNNYSLKEDTDIVFYRTYDDFIKKIKFYLQNNDKRNKIAKNLNEKMKFFTMQSILEKMFNKIETNSKNILPIAKNNIFYIINKNDIVNIQEIQKYKYIYIQDNTTCDKYLKELITFWDSKDMLKDINIADLAMPGLVINYKLPISFKGVFYSSKFFIKNKKVLLSDNIFTKYILFYKNREISQVLRIILFHTHKNNIIENIIFTVSNVARIIKGKYFA